MKLMLLFTLSLFGSVAFNGVSYAEISSEITGQYKVLGRGIQNEITLETVLLACVAESLVGVEPDCDEVRILKLSKESTPSFLGQAFHIGDLSLVREDLSKFYSEQSLERVFSFLNEGGATYAFTDQNDWNWGNNPLVLEPSKYTKVVQTLLYYVEYKRSLEESNARVGAENASTGEFKPSVSGYEGVFVAEVQEKNSNRKIIYSVTDTHFVLSLYARGKAQVISKLPLSADQFSPKLAQSENLGLTRVLFRATRDSYHWCFKTQRHNEVAPALYGIYGFVIGTVVTLIPCSILPAAPAALGIALLPGQILWDYTFKALGADARAARAFNKLMREKNVQVGASTFERLILKIKELK